MRSGHKVVCTEVSEEALKIVRHRFAEANLAEPQLVRIDPAQPLASQLPAYDHLVAWFSVYYNTKTDMQRQLASLIAGLPRQGAFIMAVPTVNDVAVRSCDVLPDGTREMRRDISGQRGALLAIPESVNELRALCDGIDIRDVVTFGMTFGGETSEYFAVYGVKR